MLLLDVMISCLIAANHSSSPVCARTFMRPIGEKLSRDKNHNAKNHNNFCA